MYWSCLFSAYITLYSQGCLFHCKRKVVHMNSGKGRGYWWHWHHYGNNSSPIHNHITPFCVLCDRSTKCVFLLTNKISDLLCRLKILCTRGYNYLYCISEFWLFWSASEKWRCSQLYNVHVTVVHTIMTAITDTFHHLTFHIRHVAGYKQLVSCAY